MRIASLQLFYLLVLNYHLYFHHFFTLYTSLCGVL